MSFSANFYLFLQVGDLCYSSESHSFFVLVFVSVSELNEEDFSTLYFVGLKNENRMYCNTISFSFCV